MKEYGQFCPIAMAAALLSERWTLLVVRDMLLGSTHFNQLRRGMPYISPTLLSKRLQTLHEHGIISRTPARDGHGWEYALTEAGRELLPLIELLGHWGKRWVHRDLKLEDVDVRVLMWFIHRHIKRENLPTQRIVVQIDFSDPGRMKHWWLVLEPDSDVDLCLEDPGYDVDVLMSTDAVTLAMVYIGDLDFTSACSGRRIRLQGPQHLVRTMPTWFARSKFADTQPQFGMAKAMA